MSQYRKTTIYLTGKGEVMTSSHFETKKCDPTKTTIEHGLVGI